MIATRPMGREDTASTWAGFEYFEYQSPQPVPSRTPEVRNPILPGFHPDPSICRVGEDYYLVTSSFVLFPGIPIYHSRDLVSWKLIGHVLDRPSQMPLPPGVRTSGGVYAPTIRYHNNRFYVTTTLVDGGGNLLVTADHPAGPWSEPVWQRSIPGIDPSPVFDDGRFYIVHNGDCPGVPQYDGHRAIWLAEVDPLTGARMGPSHLLVDGGTDLSTKPIWIEGPHIVRRDGYYYLIASEGGTAENHSVVVFRSRNLTGPYEPGPDNPILTQRDLPEDRPDKVTCAGHADLVEAPDGTWWAVFLACRPYDGNHYNTGRETFLLPVSWRSGTWPSILPPRASVPLRLPAPIDPPKVSVSPTPVSESWRDDFGNPTVPAGWVTVRVPDSNWIARQPGKVRLAPRAVPLCGEGHPSFMAWRQTSPVFAIETALTVDALTSDCDAGLAVFQDTSHHFFFGVRVRGGRCTEIFVEQVRAGAGRILVKLPMADSVPGADPQDAGHQRIELRVSAEGGPHAFHYRHRAPGSAWQLVIDRVDGTTLSTLTAGGFQGVCLGLHVRQPLSVCQFSPGTGRPS
jgi:alpha-N-arabinofuranosidase